MNRIPVASPVLDGNEELYVLDCIRTTALSMGAYVKHFEETFARVVGTRHAVTVMNGTAALHLALVALGVKPGDEVIVPTLTYVASANAVTYCGATPVFCDVHPDSWCMDSENVRHLITSKTVGIMPVHLYGHPASMRRIMDLAAAHGLWVVEDAAEAHGATYRKQNVGTFGNAGVFSFFGNKIITCGEGGMVTTNDDALAARLRLYRGQGVDTSIHRYHHTVVGYNYRMTNIQAAIGLAQMEGLPQKLAKRLFITRMYRLRLAEANIEVTPQREKSNVTHANWMFTVLVPKDVDRDEVARKLDVLGIETRPAFRCMHQLPIYKASTSFPVAETISARGLNLPTHTGMMPSDVDRVCEALAQSLR